MNVLPTAAFGLVAQNLVVKQQVSVVVPKIHFNAVRPFDKIFNPRVIVAQSRALIEHVNVSFSSTQLWGNLFPKNTTFQHRVQGRERVGSLPEITIKIIRGHALCLRAATNQTHQNK